MTSSILEKVINLFDMFSRVTKDNNNKKIPQTYTEVWTIYFAKGGYHNLSARRQC